MEALIRIVEIICILLWIITQFTVVKAAEYCLSDAFEARCPNGHLIVMQNATLGRMRIGKCIPKNLGYLGCATDVMELFDSWCSGETECTVGVNRVELLNVESSCSAMVRYLEASYECITVASTNCNQNDYTKLLPSTYISSTNIAASRCRRWTITVNPGQKVNMFSKRIGIQSTRNDCETIGYITETDIGRNKTLCLANHREAMLYSSATGNLVVNIMSTSKEYFIHYKVIGCSDLDPAENAMYSREGSDAEYGCKYSKKTWKLKCVDNAWIGVIGNCSSENGRIDNRFHGVEAAYAFPDSILIAIIVGVVLLLSSIIFICTLLCIWKQRNRNSTPCIQDPAYGHTLDPHNRGTFQRPGPEKTMTMVTNHRFVHNAQDMKPQNECDCYYPTSDVSYEFNEGRKYHVLERQPPEHL